MEQKQHICKQCNKTFQNAYQLGGHKGSHKRYDGMIIAKRTIKRACKNCNQVITTGDIRADRERLYCSNECRWENHRTKWDKQLIFNVEKGKINAYMNKVTVCEICGEKEVARTGANKLKNNKLCRDHNHATGNFRGMLCYSCNVKLGWYEKLSTQINQYIQNNDSLDKVLHKMDS